MNAIMSGLLGDSPQPDRSFGIGPPPAHTSPMPPSRTSSFTTATGSAAVKGNQGRGDETKQECTACTPGQGRSEAQCGGGICFQQGSDHWGSWGRRESDGGPDCVQ